MAKAKARGVRWGRVGVIALLCLVAAGAAFWLSLPSVEALRHANPPTTALIETRAREAREKGRAVRRSQIQVPISRISVWLVRAVVNSEDARFWMHDGIDRVELRHALDKAVEDGKLGRGASTLSQQLAKNLWLGEERSLLRKVKEAVLAQRLEALGKERVLELYLNIAEWGEGIYGAEAAARAYFQKPAAELMPEEAAILAAMLPAPRKRNPRRPSQALRRRAGQVLELFGVYKQLTPEELAITRGKLEALIGPLSQR